MSSPTLTGVTLPQGTIITFDFKPISAGAYEPTHLFNIRDSNYQQSLLIGYNSTSRKIYYKWRSTTGYMNALYSNGIVVAGFISYFFLSVLIIYTV